MFWRVYWCGLYCEFYSCFDTEEEARKFYNSLGKKCNKQIYKG